jgi:hypothetical protein
VFGVGLLVLHCGGQEFESASTAGSGGASTVAGTGASGSSVGSGGSTVTSSAGGASTSGGGAGGAGGIGGTGGVAGASAGTGGSVVDASRDSAGDAPRMDASADAPKPPDAALDGPRDTSMGSSFCSLAPHTFCSDFDEPDVLTSQWTNLVQSGGGQVSISTVQSTSHPQSVYVRTVAGGSPSNAELHKNLSGSLTSRAHVGFDIYSGAFAPSGSSNAVTFGAGTMYMTLSVSQGAQISCRLTPFGNGVTGASIACPATFLSNTWTHFDIDLTVTGQTVSVNITMAATIGTGSFQATNLTGLATLDIGSYPGTAQGYWDGYFDNIVVDMQ